MPARFGATWLLDALWRQLEVGGAVRAATGARRFTTNMGRVLFALVATRAAAPTSKLSAAEWVCQDAVILGLSMVDEDQAYREMDVLVDADTQGRVREAVFFAVANLLLEVDLLFFDTTSTYFERDDEDRDDGLRRVRALQRPPPRPAADRHRRGSPSTAASPARTTWRTGARTCGAPAGTASPGCACATATPLVEQVLSRQDRYQQVRDNLRVKDPPR